VRDIVSGGLTPSAALVRAIRSETALPLRVMVRENAGYGTDAAELLRMCNAAATFADLGVDALVLGFSRAGQPMLDELQEVLQAAPAVPATFHRAFDSLADPLRAIDTLSDIPQIDRILTDGMPAHEGPAYDGYRPGLSAFAEAPADRRSFSGGWSTPASARCARLREFTDRAGSRLTIIAGSRVDEDMLKEIARSRCVREVHVGRAAREGGQESPVTAARVRRLRGLID
jgi:copper homeostasis protein CutC